MPFLRLPGILFLAVFANTSCTPEPAEIQRTDVERIISTLASDELRGRHAFSPDAAEAADFIAGEFAAIGLTPLPGLTDYNQDFSVYQFEVNEATVTIGNHPVHAEDLMFVAQSEVVSWRPDSSVTVTRVRTVGELRAVFALSRRGGPGGFVLVDRSTANWFRRYQRFLASGNRTLKTRHDGTWVFVLTDNMDANSVSVEATFVKSIVRMNNVVGIIPGRLPDEVVLFSAHYDHIGILDAVDGDSVANGANDDASGVAAVIELGRYFKAGSKPERTLMFVAFTAEESGGYGSRYFSNQLDPDNIVAMFNIEMIGKPAVSGPNTAWITGFDKSDFGSILQRAVADSQYEFYADPYPNQGLFYRSDNATLARLGVPAHSISTTPIDVDTDYHQVSDEIETLDLDHLTNTVRAIAVGAETIISGKETPTRVDVSALN